MIVRPTFMSQVLLCFIFFMLRVDSEWMRCCFSLKEVTLRVRIMTSISTCLTMRSFSFQFIDPEFTIALFCWRLLLPLWHNHKRLTMAPHYWHSRLGRCFLTLLPLLEYSFTVVWLFAFIVRFRMSRWNYELLSRFLRSLFSYRFSWLHTRIQLFLIVLTSWCSCFAVCLWKLVIIMVLSVLKRFVNHESFIVSRVSLMTSVITCIAVVVFLIIVMSWSLQIVIVSTSFLAMAALSFTSVMSTVLIVIFLWTALMLILVFTRLLE